MENAQTPQSDSDVQHKRFDKGLDQAEKAASVDGIDVTQ
jgi:hypothetical protein